MQDKPWVQQELPLGWKCYQCGGPATGGVDYGGTVGHVCKNCHDKEVKRSVEESHANYVRRGR